MCRTVTVGRWLFALVAIISIFLFIMRARIKNTRSLYSVRTYVQYVYYYKHFFVHATRTSCIGLNQVVMMAMMTIIIVVA